MIYDLTRDFFVFIRDSLFDLINVLISDFVFDLLHVLIRYSYWMMYVLMCGRCVWRSLQTDSPLGSVLCGDAGGGVIAG